MSRRVAILTEIISPYRVPIFNALAEMSGVDLHVVFLAEEDPTLWRWRVPKEQIRFSYEVLPHWRRRVRGYNVLLNRGMTAALRRAKPDVVVCGGYSYFAMWQAQQWARRRGLPVLLWSESNVQDRRRGTAPVEKLKRMFLKNCSGFVVPGKSAAAYLKTFGVPDSVIFTAPNAVDNDFFSKAAADARRQASAIRAERTLPERYFLYVGRMIPEKGVGVLLEAYARLDSRIREETGLVLVGDGPCRAQYEQQAAKLGSGKVLFAGFQQREELAQYYALADSLVFPTFSDPWGLVVNEAMACGLPVIVSDVAGATADLVEDGWNGLVVAARDLDGLVSAMRQLGVDEPQRKSMAQRSTERIAEYSAQRWATGFFHAVTQEQLGW